MHVSMHMHAMIITVITQIYKLVIMRKQLYHFERECSSIQNLPVNTLQLMRRELKNN